MGRKDLRIVREKEFEYLALVDSRLDVSHCIFADSTNCISNIAPTVSMILTNKEIANKLTNEQYGLCITDQPRLLFFEIHNFLSTLTGYKRKEIPTSMGRVCSISPLASISTTNVSIGNNVTIEEFVVIRENTTIEDGAIIRAGSIIGGQGFEFKRKEDTILGVIHSGGVHIGSNVEIQYNTCVDRGVYPWDDTTISDNTKIDNLVHVAHGVKIGKNVMVVANSGIGGRAIIQQDSWIGFGATISNGLMVGMDARVNIGSVATKDVPDKESVSGNFAIPHKQFISNLKKIASE